MGIDLASSQSPSRLGHVTPANKQTKDIQILLTLLSFNFVHHLWTIPYPLILITYICTFFSTAPFAQCFFIFQRPPGTFRVVSFLRTLGMFRGWYHFKERLECSGWYRTTLQNQRYILWISQVSVICEFLITKLAWIHEFIFQYPLKKTRLSYNSWLVQSNWNFKTVLE